MDNIVPENFQRIFFNPKCRVLLHGGDYNPDQWLDRPDIIDRDFELMKKAGINVASLGIFAWTALEPEEGRYEFGWLDKIMDRLAENRMFAFLATPSGSRPAWMAQKYPEVLRVGWDRVRAIMGGRHNHCFTSPIYRQKTQAINRKLAERYGSHPALLLWHVSNEYSGDCHCPLCQEAFRNWLKSRYPGGLAELNQAWWTPFWSHTYTDWSQVESPSCLGEGILHLDWKRFVTDQTVDFMKSEIAPMKEICPQVPVTTNIMGLFPGLDYWKFKPVMDVVAWDNYPPWHNQTGDDTVAMEASFAHDFNLTLGGGKPYLLMESTPSTVLHAVCKMKRPGVHKLASLQALAHGADSVMYFQWRKGRGSTEKFHGAVVDHDNRDDTRVFKEVSALGKDLARLKDITGTSRPRAQVAVVFDWENRWGLQNMIGLRKDKLDYEGTCFSHYRPFWEAGIPVDIPNQDCDFSKYSLVILPMLYMVRPVFAEKMEAFVKNGGTLVATYWSGIVDEMDLTFLGGFPGPLRKVLGLRAEEIDALYDQDKNWMVLNSRNELGLKGKYPLEVFCERVHAESARVLAKYGADFYKGEPVLTVNNFGQGKAYYQAARADLGFMRDFYRVLAKRLGLKRALDAALPLGVTAQARTDGKQDYVFVMNFTDKLKSVVLKDGGYVDMLKSAKQAGLLKLGAYGVAVLRREHSPL